MIDLSNLIATGEAIKNGLSIVPPTSGVIRMYVLYRLSNQDDYYNWKELVLRYLQTFSPLETQRFTEYANKFEEHYVPRYISNMIGILRACEAIPSDKMKDAELDKTRENEIAQVEELEQTYNGYRSMGSEKVNTTAASEAFREWYAAACVLFDKWFYPLDEDWVKFQNIDTRGNGFSLNTEFNGIYSTYKLLMSRLKEGRELKKIRRTNTLSIAKQGTFAADKKINIFISYSHSDSQWLERLKIHLKALSRIYDEIEYWEDTKLRGGDKWYEEISNAIQKANVAILLVSTAFLASDFITSDELPPILRKAEKEGTRVLPVIVAPCEFEDSELGDFQAINNPDKTLADMGNDDAAIDRVFLELNRNIKCLL